MTRITLRITIAVFILFAVQAVTAQDLTKQSTPPATAPTITVAGSAERVRFTALNSVVQMHLQVYDNGGQLVFDVSSKGNVLDWTLQDSGGARLNPGSYLSVVTVKSLSGKLSQRIGSVSVQDKQLELQRVDATQMTAGQQQAVGPVEENGALTILKAGETEATTIVAHDGTQGEINRSRGALSFRLGDFFSGKDTEQMRLTAEGNLGIGTDSPQAKLDVAGVIRTSKGIEIANGTDGNVTKLTTTATGGLQQTLADGTVVANVSGAGTQDKIAKWTAIPGELGDSVITETGGRVGIGVTNPTYRLVVGPDIGPGLTTSDLTISRGPGQSVSIFAGATGANGMNFGWDEANQRAFVNAPVQSPITFTHGGVSERMRIATNGNTGIGNNNPQSLLDVAGNINTSTQYNIGGSRVLTISGSGGSNVFAGVGAGQSNSAGVNNSFFGRNAGFLNAGGFNNSFFGQQAGQSSTGNNNAFFGDRAGFHNSIGAANAFFGAGAGQENTMGASNSALGDGAGASNTTGSGNSFVGVISGFSNTGESNNTFIGTASNGAGGITNATAVGYQASVTQSNSLVLGSINNANFATADTNVGIGTTSPAKLLHISGVGSDGNGQTDLRVTGTGTTASGITLESTGTGGRTYSLLSTANAAGGGGIGGGKLALFDVTALRYRLIIDSSGNVGIGSNSGNDIPNARLSVQAGDAAITTPGNGLILRATDGPACYRVTVNNMGVLSTSSVLCP